MSTPLVALNASALPGWLAQADAVTQRWVKAQGFGANPGSHCALPDAGGGIARVLVGVGQVDDLYALAHLPLQLPAGDYALSDSGLQLDPLRAALGFAFGSYQFNRYRKPRRAPATLQLPAGVDARLFNALVRASALTRDLVNTPSEDMGPAHLGELAQSFAGEFKAEYREWVGEELLAANFPAIHAVGRASHRAPRLIELQWGDVAHPRVAIVGKGVCFDTGGLDIKPADGMRNMKKDMGGAAHALALAELIMRLQLPIRLHLLVPAVENAIGANAYRPGEVIATRKGLSVEIDNTDAEGRVVLCDALAYAVEHAPQLIVDFATLTGAARVALGADLPPIFGNDDALRDAAVAAGRAVQDPIWPMPLWQPYLSMLDSSVADIANAGPSRYAGCITAALYLQRFVPDSIPWLHLDTYAWNDGDRPGRPRGGEALGLRAIHELLRQRYGA
jgi:leucyl aminopeptidase